MTTHTVSSSQLNQASLSKTGKDDSLALRELVIALAQQQARADHEEAAKHDQSRNLR